MKGQESEERGGYRTLDVKAAGTGHLYPSHLKVPDLMGDFVRWQNRESDAHPVLRASEAHLRFVTIHPFRDGNGRVGRLLLNLLLLQAGAPLAVIPVSKRLEYISSLELAQGQGDRSALDHLVISAVLQSYREIFETCLSCAFYDSQELRGALSSWMTS